METTTKLPLAIKNLYDNHIMGMIKVVDWIEETLQIKIDYKHHILKTTCVDFHMRHDNDYIEMGPHTDDPEGKLFHFYSSQDVEIPVPIDRLGEVLAEINEHQSIGKKRIADNVEKRIHSVMISRTVRPLGIIGSTCSWYGQRTSSRNGPS